MPSPPADPATAAALDRLRQGVNPFASQVTTVGTAEESLLSGVPAFAAPQLAELLEVIGQYRAGTATTRAYPVIGDRGAGKTHLFHTLRAELRRQAAEAGDETLLVVVDRLSPGMDAIDYLLWQIVNHFLAHRGDGGRLLGDIAGRLTARLLGEALRQLAPHQRAELTPAGGFWSKLGIGGGAQTQARLDAVEKLVQACGVKHPTPDMIRGAVDEARIKPETALGVVVQHLDRTESKDVVGWLRKELYGRLALVVLLDDREPFQDLHQGDIEDAPANVKNAGNLGRRLLETWLELLANLSIPVVVVFDQLEDYVNSPDKEQERMNKAFFSDSTAKFINELRNVCLLIFAELGFWQDLLNNAEGYVRERLTQPFILPGRPSKSALYMPVKAEPGVVVELIRQRLRVHYSDLDLTGLDDTFPFDAKDVKKFAAEPSIRLCLRAMGKRYDDIVHKPAPIGPGPTLPPTPPPPRDLKRVLAELWKDMLVRAERDIENEESVGTPFIPKVQNALDGWLQCLHQHRLTGSGAWQKVELVTNTKLGAYGYLTVIRTDGPNKPGLGIAAWLGQAKGQPYDLRQRLTYFKLNPCPINRLVLLRQDGEAALKGQATKDAYEKAEKEGRDVRVVPYEPRHLHALMAFTPWLQAASAEVAGAKETDTAADTAFRDYLAELSRELLGWIDAWRLPKGKA
ncbi:hypothetical protein [Urbifossiella limnaea]|uniref:Uncharacterized protein n=1 Tax=Urbifossiella limnaea TaxID=2528023 RepID=A0A517XR64_9BACT|nr:hypothetical protein [Urbifossiella limnaea]QDU19991.1 hypothetical protein ETAA1_19340 [Urbifossiella limnaea]